MNANPDIHKPCHIPLVKNIKGLSNLVLDTGDTRVIRIPTTGKNG